MIKVVRYGKTASKIIVDDVLLCVHIAEYLLSYFRTELDSLKHHCAKLKLKGLNWFQYRYKFLWMDMAEGGTQPAHSKNSTFSKL